MRRTSFALITTTPVLAALVLAPVTASGTAGGDVETQRTVTLALATRPKVQRPTLERLEQDAVAKGSTLLDAVKSYATQKAASDPRVHANRPDGDIVDGFAIDPDVMIDDLPYAEVVDLAQIAKSAGITHEEAIRRYGFQGAVSRVVGRIAAAFPAEIAGSAIINNGAGVRIGFKGAVPSGAVELAGSLPVEVVLVGGKGFSERELKSVLESTTGLLGARPDTAGVRGWYDTDTGRITVQVKPRNQPTDAAGFRTAVQPPRPGNPRIAIDAVAVSDFGTRPVDGYLRGGGLLNKPDGEALCTNAFNVTHTSGDKGTVTARHCADDPYLIYWNHDTQGGHTTISRMFRAANYDIARFTTGGLTATRTFYYGWETPRYADGVETSPSRDEWVCAFGRTTGAAGCGQVTKVNISTTDDQGRPVRGLIEEVGAGLRGGDSGGVFHYGAILWGVTSYTLEVGDEPIGGGFTRADAINNGQLGTGWTVYTR
jgi:hypothetical protein